MSFGSMKIPIIFLGMLTATAVSSEIPAVSALTADETVFVQHTSRGCFHHTIQLYEIRNQTGFLFSAWEKVKNNPADFSTNATWHTNFIGRMSLSKQDAAGLDVLMSFYRKIPSGFGCTTVDDLVVIYAKNGSAIGTEQFEDQTCQLTSLQIHEEIGDKPDHLPFTKKERETIVTFDELVERLSRHAAEQADQPNGEPASASRRPPE